MGRALTRGLAVVVAVLVLAGCGGGSGAGPVPDDVLFAQVADLPGVESADLTYSSDVTRGQRYTGAVVVPADATDDELGCVAGQVAEILWQGRPDATSHVVVRRGDEQGVLVGIPDDLTRFGPRPTEPRPSATITPCAGS